MKDSRTIYHQIACVVIAFTYLLLWAFWKEANEVLGDNVIYACLVAAALPFIVSVFWELGRYAAKKVRPDWNDVKYGTIAGIYATGAFLAVYGIVYLIKII